MRAGMIVGMVDPKAPSSQLPATSLVVVTPLAGLAPEAVVAASRRLQGQFVRTPLIGGLAAWPMPVVVPEEVRIKAEMSQWAGSVWSRGVLHWFHRQMGQAKGIFTRGPARALCAVAAGAVAHRTPCRLLVDEPLSADQSAARDLLEALAQRAVDGMCTLDADVQAHEADARALGFRRFDLSTAEPDVAAGLATVGFDLAAEVPGDCAGIYVPECAPGFAACVATGLLAAERGDVPVYGVPVLDAAAAKPWRDALVAGLRLACDGPGLAGLLAAVAHHAEQASGVAEARVALLSD